MKARIDTRLLQYLSPAQATILALKGKKINTMGTVASDCREWLELDRTDGFEYVGNLSSSKMVVDYEDGICWSYKNIWGR
jgi:hypothetical protein